MRLFVPLSFVALALGYWALSGGAGFEPEARPQAAAESGKLDLQDVAAVTPTAAEPPADLLAEPPALAPAPVSSEPTSVAEPAPADRAPPLPSSVLEALAARPLSPAEALAALSPEPQAAPEEETAAAASSGLRRVTGDRVNVRLGPGTSFEVVGQVVAGDLTEVLERDGGWARVRLPSGDTGWMSARFLEAPPL